MLKRYSKYFELIKSSIDYSKRNFYIYLFIQTFDAIQSVFTVFVISIIILNIEKWNIDWIYFWTRIFIIVVTINLILSLFKDAINSRISLQVDKWLIKKYLNEYILLDNTKVEEYGTGKMNNIIFTWIVAIYDSLLVYVDIFVQLIATIYILILLLIKVPNIYYFIWVIIFFLLILFLYWKGLQQLFKIRKRAKEMRVVVDWRKIKVLMSKFEILQNQKINHETDEIWKIYDEMDIMRWKWIFKKRLWESGSDVMTNTFFVILFLFLWVWIISGNYSIATFTLLVWILQILSKYTWQIRMYLKQIFKHYIDIEKLLEIFETIPQYKENPDADDFEFKNGDIEFKKISFWYNEKSSVFKDFNLFLEWWKKYAFVWISGWWKSTLVKLLAWYISPKSGNVIVDNQKLSTIKLKTYYKHIGYLSQDPSVFDWSIWENLLYALDYIPSDDEINEVIRQSKCEFINELPKRLETQIWEKWIKLSWGQKQRLAIAKIMLKNPNIIILDEPTSALDSFNEEEVSIAFRNLFKNKTVVVVAHRLQTVKNSDTIFYIENWQIVEQGNHKELLKLKWKYYNMIELQSGF